MTLFTNYAGWNFKGCALGISARRLWEHTQMGQINPFALITPASAMQPQAFVDILDVSGTVPALTGCTWADLQAGKHGRIAQGDVNQLLRNVECTTARGWLSDVGQHLREVSEQRAVRNQPVPFLPKDGVSLLGVRGLHCALATWLEAHGSEKASPEQWYSRISNLTKKGLREEELEFSQLAAEIDCESSAAVTGDAIFSCLSYDALRLSVLPVVQAAGSQLRFETVPANATIKRIKPKLKAGLVSHPQWRDRVLGYWIDVVDWGDLLGPEQGWMAFTYRGEAVVPHGKLSGLCATAKEAVMLANNHAQKVFPKLTAKGKWSRYRLTGGEQYREWLVTLPYYAPGFFSSHFDHRNVLLHVRCDMREGADGERVLVLQEVQSDWAQKARRLLQGKDSDKSIPVPPWLKEWPALALKLMLLHAAQQGATVLTWTHGKVQVERYAGLGEAGLLELYDRTLPAEATRILRPYGKKCEGVEVFQPANFYIEPAEIGYEVFDDEHCLLGAAANWSDAQALLPDGAHEVLKTMHGIKLDEAMRQAILAKGFYAWGAGIQ